MYFGVLNFIVHHQGLQLTPSLTPSLAPSLETTDRERLFGNHELGTLSEEITTKQRTLVRNRSITRGHRTQNGAGQYSHMDICVYKYPLIISIFNFKHSVVY